MNGLILVSGLARCGTSLMMQMLAAGGWPVFGPEESQWPAFEHTAAMSGGVPLGASGVIKWLIPVVPVPPECALPAEALGSVFLTRDPIQQAKSHLKVLKFMGLPIGGVDARAYGSTFRRDAPIARAALADVGPVIDVSFEDLIASPAAVAERVSGFFGIPLDVTAAARQVRPRRNGASCLPYMLEEQLIAEENG